MALNFQAVSRKTSTAVGKVTPEFMAEFNEAVEYFANTEGADLLVDFGSEKERNAWVKLARAASADSGLRFRAVSNESGSARLVFRMESEAEYAVKKAQRDAAKADLEARRAAGETITRGRKPQGK